MGLEGFDLGVPAGQLLLVKSVELPAQLAGHLVEGVRQVLKLPASGSGLNLIAQLPLADMGSALHQIPDGLGDSPAEKAEGEQQQQGKPHSREEPAVAVRPGEEGTVVQGRRPAQGVVPPTDGIMLQGPSPQRGRRVPL